MKIIELTDEEVEFIIDSLCERLSCDTRENILNKLGYIDSEEILGIR